MEDINAPKTTPVKPKPKRIRNAKAKTTPKRFDTTSRVVAFIADLTTVPSNLVNIALFVSSTATAGIVLVTGGRDIGQLPTSGLVTPPVAFVMWLIAAYATIAWLHKYYEENKVQKQFLPRFWMFLLDDLIIKFRVPSRLFFPFLLSILLIWTIGYTDYYFGQAYGFLTFWFFLIIAGLVALVVAYFYDFKERIEFERDGMVFQEHLEKDWSSIEERIHKLLLDGYQWLDISELRDLATIWGIDSRLFLLAFAQYAMKHPDEAVYAILYQKGITYYPYIEHPVLISLKNLSRETYYYK